MMLKMALCIGLLLPPGNIPGVWKKSMSQGADRAPFRYVIVSNEGEGRRPKRGDGYRYVEVLLDERAFSENNLKELFRLVSKRFSTPRALHVQVYTNLEDVETPEEKEKGKISETPFDPNLERHHQAFYLRDDEGNEWFTYNPNPPDGETKKVILKTMQANQLKKVTRKKNRT